MADLLTDLTDIPDPQPALIGGKAAGLCRAAALGIRVPPAAVITATALPPQPDAADAGWLGQAAAEIDAWARAHAVTHLAIRSSAAVEDMSLHSYAGVFRSTFSRRRPADLALAVNLILRSGTSAVRDAYERAANLRSTAGPPAVLVQATVPARSSGVAFGWAGPDGPQVHVEATWGLATNLVSGISAGDSHRSGASDVIRPKPLAVYPVPHSGHRPGDLVAVDDDTTGKVVFVDETAGLAYVRLPPDLAGRSCLNPGLLGVLRTTLARAATNTQGVDVEWVEDVCGEVWLVQLRPMTAAPPMPTEPVRPSAMGRTLHGEPGAPGRWRGPVSRAETIKRHTTADGRVLVCGAARPELLPAIARAAAIVSSDAGVLCHIAIVARELGKPCVIGIPDAERVLTEDLDVDVDGAAGTVRPALTGEIAPTPAPERPAVTVGFLAPDQPPAPNDPTIANSDVVVLILTPFGQVSDDALMSTPEHVVVICTGRGQSLARRPGWRTRHTAAGWSLMARDVVRPELLTAAMEVVSASGASQ